jgi:rRNA maturation protein Nop10
MRMSLRANGVLCVLIGLSSLAPSAWGQDDENALELYPVENVRVIAKMNPDRRSFTNYIFWNDPFWDRPSSDASFYIHPADTTGWRRNPANPVGDISQPTGGGRYKGVIDRTLNFKAEEGGRVGVGRPTRSSLRMRWEVLGGRETIVGNFDIGQGYTPGTPKTLISTPDLGLTVSFSAGVVDSNGVFKIGVETFEGYHIFRSTCPVCGEETDISNIGEISREEAFRGEPFDSLYYDAMLPALRTSGVYTLPEAVSGLGSVIDIRDVHPARKLGADEFIWVDRNAFNGFTYNYLVTTFDKGYNVAASSQGIYKVDNCRVEQGESVPCPSELVDVANRVEPVYDLVKIYAVPNPYRSGRSQFTTSNYHNFPDNMMRFVNVPKWCKLKIYTPSGDLVWEYDQVDGSGVIEWDTRNLADQEVSSGIYIYRLETQSGNWVYGRIVIIR